MKPRKFIQGAFELDRYVEDIEAYEDKHRKAIDDIIDWGNNFKLYINIGTTDMNKFVVEYKIVGQTTSFCKGLLSELKAMLKDEWKNMQLLWQGSGDILW